MAIFYENGGGPDKYSATDLGGLKWEKVQLNGPKTYE
jgi:hypothetical protein